MTEDLRCLAADAVVVEDGHVLLMERAVEPCRGCWVLPGGMVERDETAREACVREVKEEVDVEVAVEDFVGLYDDPGRDRRGNVSACFLCRKRDGEPRAREEARRVERHPLDELPSMGFDHREMVEDATAMID